ncbi:MAG TPA: hypothetical protein VKV35_00830 [Streptosporangiaceae bacterium]|nr:hypothetical protein [Streptosporangiaceae bacterium]
MTARRVAAHRPGRAGPPPSALLSRALLSFAVEYERDWRPSLPTVSSGHRKGSAARQPRQPRDIS